MRLPRDLSGAALIKGLRKLGYGPTRQTGSHVRLTTQRNGEHHITIPLHDPLRVGTLASVLAEVADHHQLDRDEIIRLVAE
jgi:predicted RNA binding protein YcfA (HicA-like mRNA interferase family)